MRREMQLTPSRREHRRSHSESLDQALLIRQQRREQRHKERAMRRLDLLRTNAASPWHVANDRFQQSPPPALLPEERSRRASLRLAKATVQSGPQAARPHHPPPSRSARERQWMRQPGATCPPPPIYLALGDPTSKAVFGTGQDKNGILLSSIQAQRSLCGDQCTFFVPACGDPGKKTQQQQDTQGTLATSIPPHTVAVADSAALGTSLAPFSHRKVLRSRSAQDLHTVASPQSQMSRTRQRDSKQPQPGGISHNLVGSPSPGMPIMQRIHSAQYAAAFDSGSPPSSGGCALSPISSPGVSPMHSSLGGDEGENTWQLAPIHVADPTHEDRWQLAPIHVANPTHEDIWARYGSPWRNRWSRGEVKWSSKMWLESVTRQLARSRLEKEAAEAMAALYVAQQESTRRGRERAKIRRSVSPSHLHSRQCNPAVEVMARRRTPGKDAGVEVQAEEIGRECLSTGAVTSSLTSSDKQERESQEGTPRMSFSDWSSQASKQGHRGGEQAAQAHRETLRTSFEDWCRGLEMDSGSLSNVSSSVITRDNFRQSCMGSRQVLV